MYTGKTEEALSAQYNIVCQCRGKVNKATIWNQRVPTCCDRIYLAFVKLIVVFAKYKQGTICTDTHSLIQVNVMVSASFDQSIIVGGSNMMDEAVA